MQAMDDRVRQSLDALSGALMVPAFYVDADTAAQQAACPAASFCRGCGGPGAHHAAPHRYGLGEACRWGGRYVYDCPAGLTFLAGAVTGPSDEFLGGVILGPLVMGGPEELAAPDKGAAFLQGIRALPVVPSLRVRHMEQVLGYAVQALSASEEEHGGYDQHAFLNAMYDIRERYVEGSDDYAYLFTAERRLQALLSQRDRAASQTLLNELLSHIYFTHAGDLSMIKARVTELVVVLSRAAVVAGADVAKTFRFSPHYLHQLEKFETIDELSAWLSELVHQFILATFDYENIRHADVVHKVMDYIRKNAAERLTLEQIAGHVYLSKAYLSSVFKRELGMSISTYINQVRIEKGKRLLRETDLPLVDVAAACCFEDQSYFSRVFKRLTGMSPKQYRDTQL